MTMATTEIKSKKVIAIVQARMGSTRLPGKVLKLVAGIPLIVFLLNRLKHVSSVDQIVLATSKNSENDDLADTVNAAGFDVFRGDEDDVLRRFYDCATLYQASDIVRITGDSPLLSPKVCETLIQDYFNKQADYAYLSEHFAEGVDCEVISYAALSHAHVNASLASEREHVTLFVYQHKEAFNIIELANDSDDSGYRFTVDNQEDYQVVQAIVNSSEFTDAIEYSEIKQFLDDNLAIKQLNQHIVRNEGLIKSLNNDHIV